MTTLELLVRQNGFIGRFIHVAGNVPLLGNRKDVVHNPVKYQTGREHEHHGTKYQRHEHHDSGLHWIRRCWIQLDLQEHGGHHDGWQNEVRVTD